MVYFGFFFSSLLSFTLDCRKIWCISFVVENGLDNLLRAVAYIATSRECCLQLSSSSLHHPPRRSQKSPAAGELQNISSAKLPDCFWFQGLSKLHRHFPFVTVQSYPKDEKQRDFIRLLGFYSCFFFCMKQTSGVISIAPSAAVNL